MSTLLRQMKVAKGTVLFAPGQPCPGFLSLRSGCIRVSLTGANGREVVLYRVHPGEVCLQSFTCLIEGRPYTAEGVVEQDLTGTLSPPEVFHARLAEDAAFRQSVFAAVAHRFADFEQLVEDVALTGFDARLARVLLRLMDENDCLQATHDQLAAETASGRAFVSRRLAEFARQGWVRLARGQVQILDRDRLSQIAAQER